MALQAQNIPELLYYQFEGSGTPVPNRLVLSERFVLFPNPSTCEITIQTNVAQKLLTIEIVNYQGRVILSKWLKNTAQVSLLLEAEAGVYYVVLTTDSGKKIVNHLLKK